MFKPTAIVLPDEAGVLLHPAIAAMNKRTEAAFAALPAPSDELNYAIGQQALMADCHSRAQETRSPSLLTLGPISAPSNSSEAVMSQLLETRTLLQTQVAEGTPKDRIDLGRTYWIWAQTETSLIMAGQISAASRRTQGAGQPHN